MTSSPRPHRPATRSRWVTGLSYGLLVLGSVLVLNIVSALLAVLFRQRPDPERGDSPSGATGARDLPVRRAAEVQVTWRPPGLANYLIVMVSRNRDRFIAGRSHFPLWSLVHHQGRRSGRAYSVPVLVRVTPDVFVAPVMFGPRTNWLRNVQAAGGCVIRWRGADHHAVDPELISPAQARAYFGRLSWLASEKIVAPDLFVLLHRRAAP